MNNIGITSVITPVRWDITPITYRYVVHVVIYPLQTGTGAPVFKNCVCVSFGLTNVVPKKLSAHQKRQQILQETSTTSWKNLPEDFAKKLGKQKHLNKGPKSLKGETSSKNRSNAWLESENFRRQEVWHSGGCRWDRPAVLCAIGYMVDPQVFPKLADFRIFHIFFNPWDLCDFFQKCKNAACLGFEHFFPTGSPGALGNFGEFDLAAAQPSRSGRELLLNLQRFYLAGFDLKPMETGDDGLEHGFYDFPTIYGNVIIPTDFHSIILQRGSYTTNQESLVPDFNSPIDPARDAEGVWLPLMVLFVLCVLCVLFIWILGKF